MSEFKRGDVVCVIIDDYATRSKARVISTGGRSGLIRVRFEDGSKDWVPRYLVEPWESWLSREFPIVPSWDIADSGASVRGKEALETPQTPNHPRAKNKALRNESKGAKAYPRLTIRKLGKQWAAFYRKHPGSSLTWVACGASAHEAINEALGVDK